MTATTATTATRPVSVDELRRAWRAVQAGQFRSRPTPQPPGHRSRRSGEPAPGAEWTPASEERVLPVLGSAGWCGATTVALALATAAGGRARVVECAPVTATGLAAASTAELGADGYGWTRGSRGEVWLDRVHTLDLPDDLPVPSPVEGPILTVIDLAQPAEQVLAGDTWRRRLLEDAPTVVVAGRVSVPGVRRLESCLDLLGADRVVLALLGAPRRRWPRDVIHSLGRLTRSCLDDGWLVDIGEDRALAVHGLTPAPLPAPLIAAATRLLHLTEGTPR